MSDVGSRKSEEARKGFAVIDFQLPMSESDLGRLRRVGQGLGRRRAVGARLGKA